MDHSFGIIESGVGEQPVPTVPTVPTVPASAVKPSGRRGGPERGPRRRVVDSPAAAGG